MTFLGFTPLPNTVNGAFNYVSTPFSSVPYQHKYTARIDHNFSSRDPVPATTSSTTRMKRRSPFWGPDYRNNLGRTQNVAGTETHTFSPDADQRVPHRLAPLRRERRCSAPPTTPTYDSQAR